MTQVLYTSCVRCGSDLSVTVSGAASLLCDDCVSAPNVVAGHATSTVADRELAGQPG